ncbi:MAG TPA: lysophospholipid acyltransferase family protein [Polyangia bacterium]
MTGWVKDRVLSFVDGRFDPDFRTRIQLLATPENEYGYDPFGFSREDVKIALYLSRFLYRDYFRCEVFGIDRVPDGRVLLIGNHSGQLPYDAVCIACALMFDRTPPRMARAMIERFIPTLPFVSYLFARWGQIIGSPENCQRVLEAGEAILVFPEGAKGISKPITKRYQLQEFGNGFMRLALATRAPIVPIAVIGAEEQAPAFNIKPLAKLIGAPAFPLVPTPPFFPIVPYPTRYRIYFGEPLCFLGDPDDDDEEIDLRVKQVRNTIQSMLYTGLKERKHIFW